MQLRYNILPGHICRESGHSNAIRRELYERTFL